MRLLRVGRSHWLQQLLSAASHRREMQINRHHRARCHHHPFTPPDLDSPKRKELTVTVSSVRHVFTPDRFGNDKAMAKKQTSKCPNVTGAGKREHASGLYFDIGGIASHNLFSSLMTKMDLFTDFIRLNLFSQIEAVS
jgi:hypothetical protein